MHSTCTNGAHFLAVGYFDFNCPCWIIDVQTHPLDEGLADKTARGTGVKQNSGFCIADNGLQLERKVVVHN
jgi:hypothetical protein